MEKLKLSITNKYVKVCISPKKATSTSIFYHSFRTDSMCSLEKAPYADNSLTPANCDGSIWPGFRQPVIPSVW